ncbi:hypothetical protein FACS1894130_05070 [Spirochaetia bacterium]|nr:hypothetical protein FACS1894130_05070 [Spirochaetia bacterium]
MNTPSSIVCADENCTCQKKAFYLWKGVQYCTPHYQQHLLDELIEKFAAWTGEEKPEYRLRYLVGRLYNDICVDHSHGKGDSNYGRINGEKTATQSIIANQSFDWKKTARGAEFTISRYPAIAHYFDGSVLGRIVDYRWELDIQLRVFTLLGEQIAGERIL